MNLVPIITLTAFFNLPYMFSFSVLRIEYMREINFPLRFVSMVFFSFTSIYCKNKVDIDL